jgi:preprotein translocase subunit SecF
MKEKIEKFYLKNYKKLLFIPVILLVLSILFLGIHAGMTGEVIERDVSLKGGLTATIYTDQEINLIELEKSIEVESNLRILKDFTSGKQIGLIIESSDITNDELEPLLEKELGLTLTQDNYSVEETGSKLGEAFYRQLLIGIVIAFILMGITVLAVFRTLIPGLAVIFAALTDIVVTLAILSIFGMQLSSAGIVAFLLIIGYSIDTDILMTTRVIKKREGSIFDRIWSSGKTGLTMTFTTIIALGIGLIFTNSIVIAEMFTIIIIALFVDILTTYFTNAGILTWYAKKKGL